MDVGEKVFGGVGGVSKSFIMKLTAEFPLIRLERRINIYKRISETNRKRFFSLHLFEIS